MVGLELSHFIGFMIIMVHSPLMCFITLIDVQVVFLLCWLTLNRGIIGHLIQPYFGQLGT